METSHIHPAALAFLVAALVMVLCAAGGLTAVVAFAIATEMWIRFLTPEQERIPVRSHEDGES